MRIFGNSDDAAATEGRQLQYHGASSFRTRTVHCTVYSRLGILHRSRNYTEDKAKVVAAVWGTECIKFLATLAVVLHQDDAKKRMHCTRML